MKELRAFIIRVSPIISLAVLITLTCLSSGANGQTKMAQPKSTKTPVQPSEELTQLRAEISRLQERVTKLENRLTFQEYLLKGKQEKHDQIYLDLTEHAFQRLDTDSGTVLVSFEDATPYLNGYKIHLTIGNPSSMGYAGYKLKVRWAKTYDYNKYTEASYAEWDKSIQEKEISFTEKLEPGVWNPAEFILSPAAADQLGYITLTITTNTVSLHTK
ncbi:MAG TPA: hypothetical protein VGK01_04920 [Candidatus Angelobacter sp.]|jgi:TolA-binding protein